MKVQKIDLLKEITDGLEADAYLVYAPQWHKENYRFLTEGNFIGPFGMVLYLGKKEEIHVIYGSRWDVNKNAPLLGRVSCHGIQPYETVNRLLRRPELGNWLFPEESICPTAFLKPWRPRVRRY